MVRQIIIISTIMVVLGQSSPVHAADDLPPEAAPLQKLLIVEAQTGSASTGTEEFVEIFNPNDQPVDITGWKLQYRPASAQPTAAWTASSVKATVTCDEPDCSVFIQAQSRIVFANYPTTNSALPMTGGFAEAGGQIRLLRPASAQSPEEEQDVVGYGSALTYEGTGSAPHPQPGQSLKRLVDVDTFVDTNNNTADFFTDCGQPTPGHQADPTPAPASDACLVPQANEPEAQVLPAQIVQQTPEPPASSVAVARSYLPLTITEVFPDPDDPLTDAADEFVEIYNPNDQPVQLEDYSLRSGTTFQNKVMIGSLVLAPKAYAIITSGDSSLSLSNSGTAVRLLDPNGDVRDEAPQYGKAATGQSWVKTDAGWRWTATPTPTAANIFTAPIVKASATKKSTSTATKATPKTTAGVIQPSSSQSDQAAAAPASPSPATEVAPNFWLLGIVCTLALGYGVYEYRQEISRGWQRSWQWATGKAQ